MRILEINKFYNAKRGADKHFLDLISLLKRGNHQVADFFMRQNDDEYSDWKKYSLSTVGYANGFSLWEKFKGTLRMFYSLEAHKKINALIDEFNPDIVHVHNLYHQMSPTILFEIKKRNIPIVMTIHDWKIINPNHSLRLNGKPYRRCANGKFYQCLLDKCVKKSYAKSLLASPEMYWHAWLGTYEKNVDVYIAPSEFVKNTLIKWGMQSEKIMVLPHFMPSKERSSSRRCSFSVADSYALYAGKISKEKGVDFLIETFANLGGMKLYLAGEIEDGFEISKNSNIVNLGFLSTDQLNEYIKNSKCVVSASQLPETFGLIALEAISHGKPFVGFSAGAYGEIIVNDSCGFIADSKKAFKKYLKEIADNKVIFNEEEIKVYAKKYDDQKYLKKITELFSSLIAKSTPIDKV